MPGIGAGTTYKYWILGADGSWHEKADPIAFHAEVPPTTSSRVFETAHVWGDDAWMAERAQKQPVDEAMSIYEMHLGSWKRHPGGGFWSYDELADDLVPYLADLGFTHVELMPVMQHPFGGSWGYHVTSYFAPDSRFGDPDGFRRLVDKLHQAGIGVILDWVPGHFATDEWALARFDGTPLYEDPNPQRGWHEEWGSHIFDFGRHEVRNFLYANAVYWLEEFHADGLRVDGVASMLYLDYAREEGEWTPNKYGGRENLEAVQFLQEMNATVYKRVPGHRHDRRGVDVVAAGHRPDLGRRPGVRLQVEHGLDARHARLPRSASRCTARYHHDEMTFSLDLRVHRELRAAAVPRRGRARQGVAAPQDARRPLAAAGQPARLPRRSCGRTPASS